MKAILARGLKFEANGKCMTSGESASPGRQASWISELRRSESVLRKSLPSEAGRGMSRGAQSLIQKKLKAWNIKKGVPIKNAKRGGYTCNILGTENRTKCPGILETEALGRWDHSLMSKTEMKELVPPYTLHHSPLLLFIYPLVCFSNLTLAQRLSHYSSNSHFFFFSLLATFFFPSA